MFKLFFVLFFEVCMGSNLNNINIFFPNFEINLDPQTMIDARSMQINLQLHRGLFRYTSDGKFFPDLAKEWNFSEDKKKLTVILKESYFSDGTRITAKHVKNTFVRLFRIGSSMAADLNYIKDADKITQLIEPNRFGVNIKNDTTVEFILEASSSLILQHLATVDTAILKIEDSYLKEPQLSPLKMSAFSGPYKIDELEKSKNKIYLKKWRSDEKDSPRPPLSITIHLSDEKGYDKILNHFNVDSLDQEIIPKDKIVDLVKIGWKRTVTDLTREHFLVMNPMHLDHNTRNKLASLINVERLATEMGDSYVPAFGLIPNVLLGSLKNTQPENKKSLSPKAKSKITLFYPISWEHGSKLVKLLQSFWSGLNLEIKYEAISITDWNRKKLDKKYDILINSRGLDYPDGISILNYFRSNIKGNYYFINDPAIDKKLSIAQKEFDIKKRVSIYEDIQKLVLKKKIIIPLVFGSEASGLWGPRIANVPAHPLGFHFLPFEMIELMEKTVDN